MAEIKKITDPARIAEVACLADEIWHECYKGIISDAQIEYMVENFQSKDAMLALRFVKNRAKELGYPSVYLHVNKYNQRAITAYLANGFVNERTLDTDIGDGFVMEDYIMRAKAE